MGVKQRGGQMTGMLDSSLDATTYDYFNFAATGTQYTPWYDCSGLAWVTTFLEATYVSQSGATLDVTIEFKNERSGTAFDPSSAHSQLTNTGSNHKQHTVIGSKFRLKAVAGGTFGGTETVTAYADYFGQSEA